MPSDGWLMLGAGETVVGQTERFLPDRNLMGFYRPIESGLGERRMGSRRNPAIID
jgi:chemotaxis protein methyltransferase CheR